MGLDPRSLDRLRALGRRLPTPLPRPEPPLRGAAASAASGLHPLETETDPNALFRELMQASPDGTVPPHLLARLRELEQSRSAPQAGSIPGQHQDSGRQRPGLRQGDEAALYTAFQQMLLEDEDDG